jgi:hypothetical protein
MSYFHQSVLFIKDNIKGKVHFWIGFHPYCGAGALSRGAEIEMPPGAGAEITNCGSGSFLFITDLKKFIEKKSWLTNKFL